MNLKFKKILSFIFKPLLVLLIIILLFFIINGVYLGLNYKRIPDNQILEVQQAQNYNEQETKVEIGKEYKSLSYNIGFCAYLHDFSFFMDGGKSSWAKSADSVTETAQNISQLLKSENADFVSLQEVDSDSTRTYHINEVDIINNNLDKYSNVTACCFDSPFLFWPVLEPHGKSTSNIMTLSKFQPKENSVRRQFPVDDGITKILDYDRCYSKTIYPTSNGKNLVYYTTHMSAYSKDPTTAENQIKQIIEDMQNEFQKGNYTICGADFNKSTIDNPSKYFPEEKIYSIENFPLSFLDNSNIKLVSPFNENNPVGTCRDAGENWSENVKISNIDGFLVSSNIDVAFSDVIDTNYDYSDHNPVCMKFKLK